MAANSKLYVLEITIIRAEQVPVADTENLSTDPYVSVTLTIPDWPTANQQEPLSFRTPTIHRTPGLAPEFNARWLVSGVPLPLPTGPLKLELEMNDEDQGSKHEKLGTAQLELGNAEIRLKKKQPETSDGSGEIDGKSGKPKESDKDVMAQPPPDTDVLWDSGERELKVKKRKGNLKDHVATYLAAALTRGKVGHRSRIWARVRVVNEAEAQDERPTDTWRQHLSPTIGHLISSGTAHNDATTEAEASDLHAKSNATFIASRLQLSGPVPAVLHHRYVGYKPFIKKMFKDKGLEGKALHHALHKQYMTVYAYGKGTVYGVIGVDEPKVDEERARIKADVNSDGKSSEPTEYKGKNDQGDSCFHPHPSSAITSPSSLPDGRPLPDLLAQRFLAMTANGSYGRLFTYVMLLDSEWRFTETGSEFAVDLLSKHSMHADMAMEIAFSGEFFVRKLGDETEGEGYKEDEDIQNPKDYELVIDNDSGTYRPRKELLPDFQAWLTRPGYNLSSLGKVTVMDGFDPELEKMKERRQEVKRRAKGLPPKSRKQEKEEKKKAEEENSEGQGASDSSDAKDKKNEPKMDSGKTDEGKGDHGGNKTKMVEKEDARRAEANDDDDAQAKVEEEETGVTKNDAEKY